MYYRAAAPIISHASSSAISSGPPCADGSGIDDSPPGWTFIGSESKVVSRNVAKEQRPEPGRHSNPENLPLWAGLSAILKGLKEMSLKMGLQACSPIWPPESVSCGSEWVEQETLPMLPKGNECRVIFARIQLPLSFFRIPALGPQYLRAVSLLTEPVFSGRGRCLSKAVSDASGSWPSTESSISLLDSPGVLNVVNL